MVKTQEGYSLSTEEKSIARVVFPKKIVKNSNNRELVLIRNLVWAVFFFSRLMDHNVYAAEHLISYLSFVDLARFCATARIFRLDKIWPFICYNVNKKVLEKIVLVNDRFESIKNFEACQTFPFISENFNCRFNFNRIFFSLDNFLQLSRSLPAYQFSSQTNNAIDTFRFSYDDYPNGATNGIKFNPCYELLAIVCVSTLKVISYAGKSRDCIGQIIYVYKKKVEEEFLSVDWNSDGKILLLFTELRRYKRTAKVHCFRYQPAAGSMRKLQFGKSILIDHYISSFSIWSDARSLLAIEPDTGRIVKFTFETKNVVKTEIVDCFEQRFEGIEKLTRTYNSENSEETLFGCFTCCQSQPNVCAILKQCQFKRQHKHDVVVILNVVKNKIEPLRYLYIPGTVLSINFWHADSELWLLWRENLAEIWDFFTLVICTLPPTDQSNQTKCPFFETPAWLSSNAPTWEVNSPARVACGHFSLCDSHFHKLDSLDKQPCRTESMDLVEHYTYNDTGPFYHRKLIATAMSNRMQLTSTFVGIQLRETQQFGNNSWVRPNSIRVCKYIDLCFFGKKNPPHFCLWS